MSTLKNRTFIWANAPNEQIKKTGLNLTNVSLIKNREKMVLSYEKTDTTIAVLIAKATEVSSVKLEAI